jgi:hypothetical protein
MHPLKDFKFSFSFLNLKSIGFTVSFIAQYLSLTSTGTMRDFSHRNVKISHRRVNPPTEYKHYHKPVTARWNFVTIRWEKLVPIPVRWEILTLWWEKSLTVLVIVIDKYRAMQATANPILFRIENKNFKFWILGKWNRQNVILFNVTILWSPGRY